MQKTTTQTEKLRELTTASNEAVLPALDAINKFIVSMARAKTLANNVRWRLNPIAGNLPNSPTAYIDKETKAAGVLHGGFEEVFYPLAMAARYAKTNAETIMKAIDEKQLYCLNIGGKIMIPQGALHIYTATKKTK